MSGVILHVRAKPRLRFSERWLASTFVDRILTKSAEASARNQSAFQGHSHWAGRGPTEAELCLTFVREYVTRASEADVTCPVQLR